MLFSFLGRRMKTQGITLGVLLLLIFLFGGCTEQSAHRSYTNTIYDFSFDPPAGWQQVNSKLPDVGVLFSPVNSSNVSLIIGMPFTLSEGLALSTFADQAEENLTESGMNYTILSRDWRSIPNLQAYEIAYTYEQEGTVQFVKQVAVLRTRTVFLITFAVPNAIATQYLTEVDESIDTFQ
jgi:hypothetical protein